VHGEYQVFPGLDVGKDGHHAVALDRDGKRLHDAALVNSEARLRQVFDKLAQRGPVLMVVDQPAPTGALPVCRTPCGVSMSATRQGRPRAAVALRWTGRDPQGRAPHAPTCPGPDFDARHRRPDRSQDPARTSTPSPLDEAPRDTPRRWAGTSQPAGYDNFSPPSTTPRPQMYSPSKFGPGLRYSPQP
jgi:hypothetical protein